LFFTNEVFSRYLHVTVESYYNQPGYGIILPTLLFRNEYYPKLKYEIIRMFPWLAHSKYVRLALR